MVTIQVPDYVENAANGCAAPTNMAYINLKNNFFLFQLREELNHL
jgi:hypothetical protein